MTVSRVVNGSARVSEQTRQRVQQVMEDVGYIPNQLARSLVVRRLGLVALVVADITHPWFTELVHAAELAAGASRYTTIFGNTDDDPEQEEAFLEKLSGLRVDGVILAPSSGAAESVGVLLQRGIPFVTVDRKVSGVACDHVQGESYKASKELVRHLVWHGCRRIAIISGPTGLSTSRDRMRGWRAALKEEGLDPPRHLSRSTSYTREAARIEARALLVAPDRPDAVFAGNAFMAWGVIDAARELGLRVPEDLALVTFDDVEARAVEPFLTCAEQPARLIGQTAVDLLIARMSGDPSEPRTIVFGGQVRIRRSCGCHPGEASSAAATT